MIAIISNFLAAMKIAAQRDLTNPEDILFNTPNKDP